MKKSFFLLLFLSMSLISYVSAGNLFEKGVEAINRSDYGSAVQLFEEACPVLETNVYNDTIWKCNFNLGFAYEGLFVVWINGETIAYHERILNISRIYYQNAINISELNTTLVQISPYIFLARIEIDTGNYDRAEEILNQLEERMSLINRSMENIAGGKLDTAREVYKRFRSIIAEKFEARLIKGNIGPFGFSYIQIEPLLIFYSEKDLTFDFMSVSYEDNVGVHNLNLLRDINNQFTFDRPMILDRKGIFPFDKYHTSIFNITPPRISSNQTVISLYQPTPYKGTATFDKNRVDILIYRNLVSITLFYTTFILIIISLLFFNNSISHMKKSSFSPSNFIKRYSFWATIVGFVFNMLSILDYESIYNFYTLLSGVLVILTIAHVYYRYYHLK